MLHKLRISASEVTYVSATDYDVDADLENIKSANKRFHKDKRYVTISKLISIDCTCDVKREYEIPFVGIHKTERYYISS